MPVLDVFGQAIVTFPPDGVQEIENVDRCAKPVALKVTNVPTFPEGGPAVRAGVTDGVGEIAGDGTEPGAAGVPGTAASGIRGADAVSRVPGTTVATTTTTARTAVRHDPPLRSRRPGSWRVEPGAEERGTMRTVGVGA